MFNRLQVTHQLTTMQTVTIRIDKGLIWKNQLPEIFVGTCAVKKEAWCANFQFILCYTFRSSFLSAAHASSARDSSTGCRACSALTLRVYSATSASCTFRDLFRIAAGFFLLQALTCFLVAFFLPPGKERWTSLGSLSRYLHIQQKSPPLHICT